MPSEHDERVIRRFGIAVFVAFGLATALPFVVASATGGKPHGTPNPQAGLARAAQAQAAAPAGRD
jgi:hypothetical protein